MKQRTKSLKFLTAIVVAVAVLFGIVFAGGGYLFKSENTGDNALSVNSPASVSAAVSYDTLPDGSAYYYSDVSKIVGFRNGTQVSDVSSQPVNTSAAHGSADNPYVINTAAQWNAFAGDTANATNASKVFVLGSDIDFAGKTGSEAFKPVPTLGAKFYGCNRKLINISYDFNSLSTGSGVFNVATATAVITDLSLENVSFTRVYAFVGFFVGNSKASVINCHVHGTMSGSALTNSGIGGIIGTVDGNTSRVYVYRCSVFADFNLNCSNDGGVGGICGDAEKGAGVSAYDCIIIANYLFHTGNDAWFGGVLASTNITGNATHEIENCVAYSNITDNARARRAEGSLFQGWGASGRVVFNCKNTYTAGRLAGSRGGPYDIYGGIYYQPNASNCTFTASNVNWYAQNPYLYTNTSGSGAINKITTGQWNGTGSNTRENMWLAAASSTSPLPNNIWVNKSVINEAYMTNTDVTSTTGYTIENSPVRNPLVITVSYYNYTTNNGDVQYPVGGSTDLQVVNAGDTLFEPTSDANHKFEGWTLNKNDGSKPFKTVPATMLGDNKLYAVWSVPSASVRLTVSVSGSNYTENASTGATIAYNEGTVRLNSALSVDGMSTPTLTYSWKKDGAAVASGGNSANYNNIRNVKDSGEYTLAVSFVSPTEPLWSGSAESAAKKVTVEPATLTVSGFSFVEGDHAYSGSPYTNARPVAIMQAANGDTVTGTTRWAVDMGKFNNPDNDKVSNGKERKDILFTPDASYEGNYGSGNTYEVEFDIEFLQMTFHIPSYSNMKLTTNLEYGQRYSFNNVADMFEDMFKEYMDDPNLQGYTPVFQWNGQKVKINDFRKLTSTGSTGTNNAYYNVNESKTIVVEFTPQTYTVTFEPRNGVAGDIRTESDLNYGVRLTKPADPSFGMQLFLGWYYDVEVEKDGATTTETRKWSFDNDRVTGDITLYGKWLDADTFTGLKVAVKPGAKFDAKEELDPENITVTACFEGQAEDGTTITSEAVLDSTQYVITYSSGDSRLHVTKGGTTPVTISYTFVKQGAAPVTKDFTLNLTVTPILIDTSKLTFKDKREVYDGTAKKLEITGNMAGVHTQLSPSKTKYTYIDENGDTIAAADVKELGEYLVRAEFNVPDDYNAPAITAKLYIIAANLKVTLSWGTTTFVYNGQPQHPTPTFTDENGDTVELDYHLTGDNNVTNVGNGYSVTVVLDTEGYDINGLNSTLFAITKAVLKTPVFKGGLEYTGTAVALYDAADPDADPEQWLEGFNPSIMEIDPDSDASGTHAKKYAAVIRLKDTANSSWESTTSRQVTVQWEIESVHLSAIWDSYEHLSDGKLFYPKVERFIGIVPADLAAVNYATDVSYTGDTNVSAVGSYTITAALNSSAAWTDNYILDDGQEWSFVIVPKSGMQIISIVWGGTELTFNNEVQSPTYTVMLEENGKDPVDITADAAKSLTLSEVTSKWAGDYTVTVSVKDGSNYFIREGGQCSYRIVENADGEGKDPDGEKKPDDGTNGDKPSDLLGALADLPLWQLGLGLLSVILIIVFTAKGAKYGSERKKCIKQTTKIMAKSAACPAALLALFGLGDNVYTIIACALAGLAVLALVYMIVQKRRLATAAEGLENAQEEHALAEKREQEDERRRREEEFKMMMASMMNPNAQQMQGNYVGGDVREIVGEVVASLMPAMQQSMALPEPSNELKQVLEQQQRMIEQQGQMIEQLAYNQQQMPALPAPDEDRVSELEARLAEQQRLADERLAQQLAQQQELMAQQQAMMAEQQRIAEERAAEQQRLAEERAAEQQRLADERMERLMMQFSEREAAPTQTVVQTDDGLREILEKHGEMLDALMGKENVNRTVYINNEAAATRADAEPAERLTLREAYAQMPKKYQKLFDELEAYIMTKPEAVETEGKFAITFKCMAKQFVKLCIKKGFPTMQYTTEGEQLRTLRKKAAQEEGVKVRFKMSELQVFDESTMEVAKGVIDLRAQQVERDIEFAKEQRAAKRKGKTE